jgi:hypothetical protein
VPEVILTPIFIMARFARLKHYAHLITLQRLILAANKQAIQADDLYRLFDKMEQGDYKDYFALQQRFQNHTLSEQDIKVIREVIAQTSDSYQYKSYHNLLLGMCYEFGIGGKTIDLSLAIQAYTESWELYNIEAGARLGSCLQKTDADSQLIKDILNLAKEKGSASASFMLGLSQENYRFIREAQIAGLPDAVLHEASRAFFANELNTMFSLLYTASQSGHAETLLFLSGFAAAFGWETLSQTLNQSCVELHHPDTAVNAAILARQYPFDNLTQTRFALKIRIYLLKKNRLYPNYMMADIVVAECCAGLVKYWQLSSVQGPQVEQQFIDDYMRICYWDGVNPNDIASILEPFLSTVVFLHKDERVTKVSFYQQDLAKNEAVLVADRDCKISSLSTRIKIVESDRTRLNLLAYLEVLHTAELLSMPLYLAINFTIKNGHAIGCRSKDGAFQVWDYNDPQGIQTFSSLFEAVNYIFAQFHKLQIPLPSYWLTLYLHYPKSFIEKKGEAAPQQICNQLVALDAMSTLSLSLNLVKKRMLPLSAFALHVEKNRQVLSEKDQHGVNGFMHLLCMPEIKEAIRKFASKRRWN